MEHNEEEILVKGCELFALVFLARKALKLLVGKLDQEDQKLVRAILRDAQRMNEIAFDNWIYKLVKAKIQEIFDLCFLARPGDFFVKTGRIRATGGEK